MKLWLSCIVACSLIGVVPVRAQDDNDPADEASGTRLQQQIDELRARGVSEDDPQLRNLLRFQEMLKKRGSRPRARHQEPPANLDRLKNFVSEHKLESLFNTLPDGKTATPQQYDRSLARHRQQITEMMGAFERGNTRRGEKIVESVKLGQEIAKLAHRYQKAPPASETRTNLRRDIDALLHKQVRIDLEVREMKLQEFAERLEKQQATLRKDRDRIDEIVARKLERQLIRAERRANAGGRGDAGAPDDAGDDGDLGDTDIEP